MPLIAYRDVVEIHGTNSYLDGQLAVVVGVASEHPEFTTYILELDEETRRLNPKRWKCLTLTEACFTVLPPF